MTTQQVSSLLQRLAGAFADSGFDKEAEKIRNTDSMMWNTSTYHIRLVVECLTILERQVTNVGLWKAIVLLKAVIAGKKTEQEFTDYIWEIQGLK